MWVIVNEEKNSNDIKYYRNYTHEYIVKVGVVGRIWKVFCSLFLSHGTVNAELVVFDVLTQMDVDFLIPHWYRGIGMIERQQLN